MKWSQVGINFCFVFMLSIAGGALTLMEIVDDVSTVKDDANEVGDSEVMDIWEVEAEEPAITRQEAQSALNLVRRFVEKNFADPAILKSSDLLDEAFYQYRKNNEKQSVITSFFPALEWILLFKFE